MLHYQPKVELATGEVHGVEALVRWHHPTLGAIAPDRVRPARRGHGADPPADDVRARDRPQRSSARGRSRGYDLTMAINLSARSLLDIGFPRPGRRACSPTHGVTPSRLVLEITESTLMTDPARAQRILHELNGLGIRISIDDFGTGYSSLAHLKEMPVHELKIDRAFVTSMQSVHSDAVIVRSTIDLARNLGLSVVAEGVEDGAVLGELVQLGCDAVQGYHLSYPVPAGEFLAWLDAQQLERRAA